MKRVIDTRKNVRVMFYDGGCSLGIGGSVHSLLMLTRSLLEYNVSPRVASCFPESVAVRFHEAEIPVDRLWQPRSSPFREDFNRFGRTVKNLAWLGELCWKSLALASYLSRHRIDLVHTNNDIINCAPAILAAKFLRLPCVCHLRGMESIGVSGRWLSRLPQIFVAVSSIVRKYHIEQGLSPDRIVVVYNSVLTDQNLRPPRRSSVFQAERKGPRVGMFDRFSPDKGHQFLADVARLVLQRCPNAEFWIVGYQADSAPANEMRRVILEGAGSAGIEHAIRILPFVDDVAEIMQNVDVVIRLSPRDNFGRTLIEAMTLGKPVVCFSPGADEVLKDGIHGYLIPPGNLDMFARRVGDILVNDKLRRYLGEAAKEVGRTRFHPAAAASRIAEIYCELLGPPLSQLISNRLGCARLRDHSVSRKVK